VTSFPFILTNNILQKGCRFITAALRLLVLKGGSAGPPIKLVPEGFTALHHRFSLKSELRGLLYSVATQADCLLLGEICLRVLDETLAWLPFELYTDHSHAININVPADRPERGASEVFGAPRTQGQQAKLKSPDQLQGSSQCQFDPSSPRDRCRAQPASFEQQRAAVQRRTDVDEAGQGDVHWTTVVHARWRRDQHTATEVMR
jgi:hypothetical protein